MPAAMVRRLLGSLLGLSLIVGGLLPIDEVGAAGTPTPPPAAAPAKAAPTSTATKWAAKPQAVAPGGQSGLPTATYTVTRTPGPPNTATPATSQSATAGPAASGTAAARSGLPTMPPAAPSHTATATPTATPSPTTAPPTATATPVELPTLAPASQAVKGWLEGSLLALDVPVRSQFDGTEYQAANCGPASLGMVLEAFGVEASTSGLRNLANRRQGTYDRDAGIALPYLADIAATAGVRAFGLSDGAAYHRWSVEEVRDQVRRGHPVITLVKLRELPDHAGTRSDTDHYVVVVGLDGERLLVNDPARAGELGFRRPLTPDQLERAWDASSIQRHAVAFAAPPGLVEVSFPAPGAGAGPGAAVAAADPGSLPPTGAAMTLPQVPPPSVAQPPPQPVAPQPGGTGAAPQVLVVVTPVIYVKVNMPPLAQPAPPPEPTRSRWARIESPAMPASAATPPPAVPSPALVLAASGTAPDDAELRWVARFAMLSVGALVLRWSLK